MERRIAFAVITLGLVAMAAWAAPQWNLHNDFSYSSTPPQVGDGAGNAWFYDYAAEGTLATSYTHLDQLVPGLAPGSTRWATAAAYPPYPYFPFVGPRIEDSDAAFAWATPGVHAHPWGDFPGYPATEGADAIVTWKAPADGWYRFDYAAQHVDPAWDGVRVSVRSGANDAMVLLPGTVLTGNGKVTGAGTLPLSAGQEVHLRVNRNGHFYSDSTNVQMTVTPTTLMSWNPTVDAAVGLNPLVPRVADVWGNQDVWHVMFKGDTVRDGNYLYMNTFDMSNPSWPGWTDTRGLWGTPSIRENVTGMPISDGGTMVSEPGELQLHPPIFGFNPDGSQILGLTVLGWRSPVEDYVSLEGLFADMNPGGGNGVAWFIDQLLASDGSYVNLVLGQFGNGGSQLFSNGTIAPGVNLGMIPVHRGDFLFFIVDPNGDVGWDSTALRLRIDYMGPEPGTMALLAIGSLGLLRRRRR